MKGTIRQAVCRLCNTMKACLFHTVRRAGAGVSFWVCGDCVADRQSEMPEAVAVFEHLRQAIEADETKYKEN